MAEKSLCGIKLLRTTPYYSQCNGQTECMNSITWQRVGMQRRDRRACLQALHSGDKALVQSLTERGGTNKMKSYWKENAHTVIEAKDQEGVTYAVSSTKQPSKIKILYWNLLLSCQSLLEEPESIQLKIDRVKQKDRREQKARNMNRFVIKMIVVVMKKSAHLTSSEK